MPRRRSASCSPNGRRPPASLRWCSTAAATCSMAGSRPWPTPPARAACNSRKEDDIMARTPGSRTAGGPPRRSEGDGERSERPARERRPRGRDRDAESAAEGEFVEKLVSINRVAKVVKGGRRFGFAALVVVGDRKGRVGYGSGKAREVPEAIRKATEQARRNMSRVRLREGRTLHHDIKSSYGAGKVIVRAARAGTGIIAGGPMRAIFEALGVHAVVAKPVGSPN